MTAPGADGPHGAFGPAAGSVDGDGREAADTADEEQLLASLGRRARTVNLARVVRLLALLDSAEDGGLAEAARREAEDLAHQVVGSAGTFGYPAASVEAVVVEDWFAADPLGSGPSGVDAGCVRATLNRLRADFGGRAQP